MVTFFRQDFWPNLDFLLEDQIKLVLNILFWNCQGIRPKRKEQGLCLKENVTDIIALNETFLNKKLNFHISGGVAFLVQHGLVINKEYRNSDLNIITENEALAIDL